MVYVLNRQNEIIIVVVSWAHDVLKGQGAQGREDHFNGLVH